MTTPPPICACCREPIGLLWRVTRPAVYVICGSGGCEQWAWAQGLSYADTKPAPARRVRVCDGCGGDLPRRTRDRLHIGTRLYCNVTCSQR